MANINTKSIREQVADVLRSRIINGELKPGDRISERDISRELNISTTPYKRGDSRVGDIWSADYIA